MILFNTFCLDSCAIAAKIHHGSISCISFTSQSITSPDQSELIIVRIRVTSATEAIITDYSVCWRFRKVRFRSQPPESSSLLEEKLLFSGLHQFTILRIFWRENSNSHCLKITQNVAFEFFNIGIFHQFLSY